MSAELRLILFDVDGTLVDSQADILSAMGAAFAQAGLPAPDRGAVLSIIGLSLPQAMAQLAPDAPRQVQAGLDAAYRRAFRDQRLAQGADHAPLYPGALELLHRLNARPETLLGVATGKSRRGLDAVIETHGLQRLFVTRQVADDHPSKPHPAMIEAALSETGVARSNAVMIGDTSFDMEMARAAGIDAIGVSWGYHPPERLGQAGRIVESMAALAEALEQG